MPFFNPFGNSTKTEKDDEHNCYIPRSNWNRGTYRELRDILNEMPDYMMDQTVTIYDSKQDEYVSASSIGWTGPGSTLGGQYMFISVT